MPRRQGLIRARLRGAKEATGKVLYFADGHTECNYGWLEPLLSRITENRKVLAVPSVDPIDWNTVQYQQVAGQYVGSFDWNLVYFYKTIRQEILDARKRTTDPIPNPVMVGCTHAIDRDYFFETGAYDETMEIWGGENIEHSFRLWMCGGRVEMIPCSKVGHIFKPSLLYSFGIHGKYAIQRNLVKVAEVWMDDHKKYYYATQKRLPPIDVKSMLQRKKLRRSLRCKSFDWYMKNILPDMPIPPIDARYFGKIYKADDSEKCIAFKADVLKVARCDSGTWKSVSFVLDENGRFRFEQQCIDIIAYNNKYTHKLKVKSNCSQTGSSWIYDSNSQHLAFKALCLEEDETTQEISARVCDLENQNQKWNFEIELNFSRNHDVYKTSREHQMIPRKTRYFGAMINIPRNYCLNIGDENEYEMIPCDEQPSYFKIIHLDIDKRLVYEDKCVVAIDHSHIEIEKCNEGNETQTIWHYDRNSKHFYTTIDENKLCWTLEANASLVYLIPCDISNVHQMWNFHSSSR